MKDLKIEDYIERSERYEIVIPDDYRADVEGDKIIFEKKLSPEDIRHGDVFACTKSYNGFKIGGLYMSIRDHIISDTNGHETDIADDKLWLHFRRANKNELNYCHGIVKTKFSKGEWIIDTDSHRVYRVEDAYCYGYRLSCPNIDGDIIQFIDTVNGYWRKWTLNDALIGDILFFNGGVGIFIGTDKEHTEEIRTACYYDIEKCYYDIENDNFYGEHRTWPYKDVCPATKEQREILYAQMKKNGLLWNALTMQCEEQFCFKKGHYYTCIQECFFGKPKINYHVSRVYFCPELNHLEDDDGDAQDWSVLGDFSHNYFKEADDNGYYLNLGSFVKDKAYICTKDFELNGHAFKKGNIYFCGKENTLTSDDGRPYEFNNADLRITNKDFREFSQEEITKEMFPIFKGDKFRCTKDVWMEDLNKPLYRLGVVYRSLFDGCITDDEGNDDHKWTQSRIEYFKPVDVLNKIIDDSGQ